MTVAAGRYVACVGFGQFGEDRLRVLAEQRRSGWPGLRGGREEWNARHFDGARGRVFQGNDEAPVSMWGQGEHAGHVGDETERHAPLLRFVEQLGSTSARQRFGERCAEFLEPLIRVHPGHRSVARILGDVLAAQELAEHVPLRSGQGVEADVSVGRRQHVAGSRARADAGVPLRGGAAVLVHQRGDLRPGKHGLLDAYVDVVAAAVTSPAQRGQLGGCRREGTRESLRRVAAQLQGFAVGYAAQVTPAAHGTGDEVRRLEMGLRTERAETGDRGEDDGGVPRREGLVADPLRVKALGGFACDHDVEVLD